MDLQKFERDVQNKYATEYGSDVDKNVADIIEYVAQEWSIPSDKLSQHELKVITKTIVDTETNVLHDEVQDLLVQKERIERQLERKRDDLQEAKYKVFDAIETTLDETSFETLGKLHQIKLQTIDLFDMLEEMVESAIVTTLEKGHDTEETIEEITKELTFETLSEGPLSTIRIRTVMSAILQTATDVADASPTKGEEIIRGTMRGMRTGLVKSISHFKKQLLYMPDEAKSLLTSGYDGLHDELQRSDQLFTQLVDAIAEKSSSTSKTLIEKISKEIHYDLQELLQISKETVEILRDRFSQVVQRSTALKSNTAKEAKRMGAQAWVSAKGAMNSAIQNAKGRIEKK